MLMRTAAGSNRKYLPLSAEVDILSGSALKRNTDGIRDYYRAGSTRSALD
jgi:hypothetical protein